MFNTNLSKRMFLKQKFWEFTEVQHCFLLIAKTVILFLSLSRCYHRIIITKQNTMTIIYSGLDLKLQSSLAVLWDHWSGRVRVMVFNATFNNISAISWRSVLLVEETGVPVENHWPVTSHWKTMRSLKGRQLKWSFNKKSGIFFNHNTVTKWGFNCLQRLW